MADWQTDWNVDSAGDRDVQMAAPSSPPRALLEPEREETPLEQLIRHWMNERHAPDILPAQEALLSSILDHLRRQVLSSPRHCALNLVG